ncbi:MAG TPA: hypothetical protein VIB78_13145, partial [Acidimicrobiia bacterium]
KEVSCSVECIIDAKRRTIWNVIRPARSDRAVVGEEGLGGGVVVVVVVDGEVVDGGIGGSGAGLGDGDGSPVGF